MKAIDNIEDFPNKIEEYNGVKSFEDNRVSCFGYRNYDWTTGLCSDEFVNRLNKLCVKKSYEFPFTGCRLCKANKQLDSKTESCTNTLCQYGCHHCKTDFCMICQEGFTVNSNNLAQCRPIHDSLEYQIPNCMH